MPSVAAHTAGRGDRVYSGVATVCSFNKDWGGGGETIVADVNTRTGKGVGADSVLPSFFV